MTQAVKEQFTQIVKRACQEFINGRVNDRLQTALQRTDGAASDADDETTATEDVDSRKVVTTDEELQGFYIVKAILSATIDVGRVFIRDTMSYCGILLDDNNRKPICRLHFNASQKQVGVFDERKHETTHPIENINGMYAFADAIRRVVAHYDATRSPRRQSEDDADRQV